MPGDFLSTGFVGHLGHIDVWRFRLRVRERIAERYGENEREAVNPEDHLRLAKKLAEAGLDQFHERLPARGEHRNRAEGSESPVSVNRSLGSAGHAALPSEG